MSTADTKALIEEGIAQFQKEVPALQKLKLVMELELRGRGDQRRGSCPVHGEPGGAERTFSVHLGKSAFQCFHADCGVKGNVLDLWAAIHRLPLYDAALNLAETFGLLRNREEEPVARTRLGGETLKPSATTQAN